MSRKVKKPIGIGIIGSGGIAQAAHMPGYAAYPDLCCMVAVADINPEVAKAAAEKFNVPHVFTDYRELLKLKEVDAVSICTPNYLHKQPTIDALEAGKHVLVEKPMAMNAQEGREMLAAAKRTGKKLQVALNMRFSTGVRTIKRFIDAGKLGEIYYARAQALRRRGIPGWGVFTRKDKQGGGPLIDIGVHILDATLFFMGHPRPVSVSGMTYTKFGTREGVVGLMGQWDPKTYTVEDFAVGLVRFENDATLVIESSFCANIEHDIFNTTILGTEGGAQLNPLKLFREEEQTLLDITPYGLREVNSHQQEVYAFLQAIINDTEPEVTAEQGLMATEIIDAIYASAETGREVALK
jgi:predicted dehydrogenase